MVVSHAQLTGIGVTSPLEKLHVSGGWVHIEDTLYPWMSFVNGTVLQGFLGAQGPDMRLATWPGTNTTGRLLLQTGGIDRLAVTPGGNVGIGTVNPQYRLHVKGDVEVEALSSASPASVTVMAGLGREAGLVFRQNLSAPAEMSTMVFDAVNSSIWTTGTAVRMNNTGMGIQNNIPLTSLHVLGGQDAGLSVTKNGYVMLGPGNGANLLLDNNEIVARDSTLESTLYLQRDSGDLEIGNGAAAFRITETGEINRPAITGGANLLPVCYGKVNANGIILSGTQNFTVGKPFTGNFEITIFGIGEVSANPGQYMILASPTSGNGVSGVDDVKVMASIINDNKIQIRCRRLDINYTNKFVADDCGGTGCNLRLVSLISSVPGFAAYDSAFVFMVYKL